jgi:hypothetical protein
MQKLAASPMSNVGRVVVGRVAVERGNGEPIAVGIASCLKVHRLKVHCRVLAG